MIKTILTLLLSVLVSLAVAADTSVVTTPGSWDLYKASTKVGSTNTELACVTLAQSMGAATYTCRTSTKVVVSLNVIDVCLNISGVQATVPVGMKIDASGNCVAATDPNMPPGVIGYTGTVPAGYTKCADEGGACAGSGNVIYGVDTYWRMKDGVTSTPCTNTVFGDPRPYYGKACYLKPTVVTQTDVCPNITGIQVSIPSGMILDAAGNCVTQTSTGAPTYVGGVEPGIFPVAGLVSGTAFNVDFGAPVNAAASYTVQVQCNGEVQGAPVVVTAVTWVTLVPSPCAGKLLSLDINAVNANGTSEPVNVPGLFVK